MATGDILIFDRFRLDVLDERLWQEGRALAVRRKTFALLRHLIEHPERLVSKEALLDAIWNHDRANEAVLTECIRELRKLLGDDPKTPKFIETVHGRGYRWIAKTERLG